MTTPFYGFPKANTGVTPEAAKFYELVLIRQEGASYFTYDCSESRWDFYFGVLAYIVTDIPI